MNNAQAIFDSLNEYADVQQLLGKQEDIFLDFKQRWTTGTISGDEKKIISKATSGFAHQQGGVLVWGVEGKKGANGIDEATSLKPFVRPKQFKQELEDYTKYATEPIVDGVLHRAIFVSDDESSDKGFVISYFPKSSGVHRALGDTPSDFYKRHGDSFTPLSTDEIKNLFFRTLAPDLMFVVEGGPAHRSQHYCSYPYYFGLENAGSGIARFASLYVGLVGNTGVGQVSWFDGEGNQNFHLGRIVATPSFAHYAKHFVTNGDVVIYPGQKLMLCGMRCQIQSVDIVPPGVRFRVFAENMPPKEGEVPRP